MEMACLDLLAAVHETRHGRRCLHYTGIGRTACACMHDMMQMLACRGAQLHYRRHYLCHMMEDPSANCWSPAGGMTHRFSAWESTVCAP